MKKTIAVIIAIIFLFAAFWLGEEGKGLFQVWPYLFGLVVITVIPSLVWKKWAYRIFYCFLCTIFSMAAFYMGGLSFSRAYDSCLEEAEQVRTALSDYEVKNGKYPDVLDDLNMKLPCSRYLRGTILKYENTASDYRIWFKDWLVEHSATAKEPFLAHK